MFVSVIMLFTKSRKTRMHSSRMCTARSSSHPGGGGGSPPGYCYGLLVWWPPVMAFWCGGLLVWCLLLWPSGVVAFCYGLPAPQRPYQKASFNQKTTKPEGHNRRPQQKATPPEQTPLGPGTPQARHPPGELLQGMLGYHLQCMLG